MRVDRWICTGCGMCVGKIFTLEGGLSAVRPEFRIDGKLEVGLVPEELSLNVKRAASAYPNRGIYYSHLKENSLK